MKKRWKVSEVIKILKDDGWYLARQKGTSHRQFNHPIKKKTVTVAGKPSETLHPGIFVSIMKQAGLK